MFDGTGVTPVREGLAPIRALFCYGTLQLPENIFQLTGRLYKAQRAQLQGYAIYRVRGNAYPGIVSCEGGQVDGVLYLGISAHDLQEIDRYEGELYERRIVEVRTRSGTMVMAWAYVVPWMHRRRLSSEGWNLGRLMDYYAEDRLPEDFQES